MSDHEKSVNAFLAWEFCAREPSKRFNLLTPWRSASGVTIYAADGYRLVAIDAETCGSIDASVLYELPCVEPSTRPDIAKTLDGYRWDRQDWRPLPSFPRLIRVEDDVDEGDKADRYGDLRLGGLLFNAEYVWPFTLVPGAQWAVDGVALLIRWDSGVGVVMSRNPPHEDAA